ncbi:MAG: hypothetical protein DWQ37_03100 [Planctomycetota bacterium]|nr:MAG: hypothetical protein DWQ37_03100 [Planctomycetota bacterium]
MRICISTILALLIASSAALSVRADEWEENSPYFEDDAWYDISEWFDGNDYNPTDEEFGEWDSEQYDFDTDTADIDNDTYGFNAVPGESWFYDFFDQGDDEVGVYNRGVYESGARFYDYDHDGTYDAYASWHDEDWDGVFDEYVFYPLSDLKSSSAEQQQQRAMQEAPKSSKAAKASGTIERTKQVKVRGKQHTVVSIKPADGPNVVADLGRTDRLSELDVKNGQQITVAGLPTQVGDKKVLLATTFDVGGQERNVNRQRRDLHGKVVDTRKAKVRGRQHLIAIVENDKGNKVAVDFGPAERLDLEVSKGDQLTFRGAPVKIKDKRMFMALSIDRDGETVKIDRHKKKQDKES